jgi:hypothetical protein
MNEITQREKRQVLENDRRVQEAEERRMRTYHGHVLDGELDLGGRFAKVHTTTVVGTSPVSYPQQPSGSPWGSDPVSPEMPLGIDINAQEPTGANYTNRELRLQTAHL